MKALCKLFALALFIVLGKIAVAQPGLEDVIYLKNGNVYRGVIVEQVPGQYYNMQTIGGNIFRVDVADVSKISKEPRFRGPEPGGRDEFNRNDRIQRGGPDRESKKAYKDSLKAAWTPRIKGYFFQGQLLIENLQGGIRLVNGYKFGRFGHVGFGLGIDLSGPSVINRWSSDSNSPDFGIYFPFYIHYSGDILKKRITPFYAIELGYTVGRTPDNNYYSTYDCIDCIPTTQYGQTVHGAMGGAGIGVRFNTRKRLNFSLLFNVNFKNIGYKNYDVYYDQYGNYIQSTRLERTTLVYPGLRLGLGF